MSCRNISFKINSLKDYDTTLSQTKRLSADNLFTIIIVYLLDSILRYHLDEDLEIVR